MYSVYFSKSIEAVKLFLYLYTSRPVGAVTYIYLYVLYLHS